MIQLSNAPRTYPHLSLRKDLFLGQVRLAQGAPQDPTAAASPQNNLLQNGATLQVQVSVPAAYQQAGGAAPAPQTLTAMIDSGASISCITIQAAQQLGLQQVSSTQLGGVGGSSEAPIYAAALNLVQFGVNVDPVQIAGVSNPLPNVDMLIGRDILQTLNFDYKGAEGAFTVTQDQPGGGAPATPTTQNSVAAAPPTPGTVPPPQAPGAPAPQGNLPQPPASNTILGMPPLVAVGAGVGVLGLTAGALFLFDVF